MKAKRKPNLLGLFCLALVFITGPSFWQMDVGDRVLSIADAWETGAAQTVVTMGVVLLILTTLLWRGALWPRWLILAWCPFCILYSLVWTRVMDIGRINPIEFGLIGIPVMLFWVWGTWRHLFARYQ